MRRPYDGIIPEGPAFIEIEVKVMGDIMAGDEAVWQTPEIIFSPLL